MMLGFNTVVLERLKDFTGDFETEPYETGWAREAIFFIRVHAMAPGGTILNAFPQISADGIEWMNDGSAFAPISGPGDSFLRVSHFGGWLRLRTMIKGSQPRARLTIQLALKS
jgi:hypothetical protein